MEINAIKHVSLPFDFTCAWTEKRTKNFHKCQIEAVTPAENSIGR